MPFDKQYYQQRTIDLISEARWAARKEAFEDAIRHLEGEWGYHPTNKATLGEITDYLRGLIKWDLQHQIKPTIKKAEFGAPSTAEHAIHMPLHEHIVNRGPIPDPASLPEGPQTAKEIMNRRKVQ